MLSFKKAAYLAYLPFPGQKNTAGQAFKNACHGSLFIDYFWLVSLAISSAKFSSLFWMPSPFS